jgi:hypothetical protein
MEFFDSQIGSVPVPGKDSPALGTEIHSQKTLFDHEKGGCL